MFRLSFFIVPVYSTYVQVYKWLKEQKAGIFGLTRIKVCCIRVFVHGLKSNVDQFIVEL